MNDSIQVNKYYVRYGKSGIDTTVTDRSQIVDHWIQEIYSHYNEHSKVIVGLDVEWKPNFKKKTINKAATLQLCIGYKCLIIQLQYIDEFPTSLKTFLMDSKFVFSGNQVKHDAEKLKNEYGLEFNEMLDIQAATKAKWPGKFQKFGLMHLARDVAGLNLKKSRKICMSNWENRTLSGSQVVYACLDAFASYSVGHKIVVDN